MTLLAPQGAEYWAVRRGADPAWPVVAIPLGGRALPQQVGSGRAVILLGLAGGLQPGWAVGDAVICQSCTDAVSGTTRSCDPLLTAWLSQRLGLPVARALTVPRIVTQPQEKQTLGQTFGCAVVEMEGYPLLAHLPHLAMVRVISDAMHQTLPPLEAAVDRATGHLRPLPLVWAMVRQPRAAMALVQGARLALERLTGLAQRLTGNSEKKYNKNSATDVSALRI